MGFFKSKLERELEGAYGTMLGTPNAGKQVVSMAKRRLRSRLYKVPATLELQHALFLEGVTPEETTAYWTLDPLEMECLDVFDEIALADAFLTLRRQGLSIEEAAARVRAGMPIYGDPNDTTHASGDDRPLPRELRSRVNASATLLSAEAPRYSSMNACVRALLVRASGKPARGAIPSNTGDGFARRLSNSQVAMLERAILHAGDRARAFMGENAVPSALEMQIVHSIGVVVAAIYLADIPYEVDSLIDVVSAVQGVPEAFREFTRESDVREGLRRTAREAGLAVHPDLDTKKLSHLLQLFLVSGLQKPPSELALREKEGVLAAAADIGADAAAGARFFRSAAA